MQNEEKDYSYTGYNKNLKKNAQSLRVNMTRHERHLWYDYLKDSDVRWRRQRPIDKYIADYYCSKAKLVIELDGNQHYTDEGLGYDAFRTEIINNYGIEILRFSNTDIDRDFELVCRIIENKVSERRCKLAE